MLNSKQRSNLRSMASTLDPICIVGKNGISEALLKQLSDALEKHELIKISVLKHCELSPLNLAQSLAVSLNAEPVGHIGSKVILYRRSKRENIEHIVF